MNYYYDTYSQSLSKEIPNSKNSLLKTMINLGKFGIGQSYVTCKIKNKGSDSVVVNIQGGTPGIDLSYLLFNVANLPKFAYLRTIVDNKILIRKLPVLDRIQNKKFSHLIFIFYFIDLLSNKLIYYSSDTKGR
jgi:hypothetical protein